MRVTTHLLSLPDLDQARVVVPAPGPGPGNWAGAASAVRDGDDVYITYRVRRPLAEGRGVSVVVARSRDGIEFTPVCEVWRDEFGAESFERPVLARLDEGWRLYLSCATPATSTGGSRRSTPTRSKASLSVDARSPSPVTRALPSRIP